MSQAYHSWKIWLLSAGCISSVIWLAGTIVSASWETSRLAAQGGVEARQPITIDRPPLRTIKDPHPSFSAVAVNSDNNMLVVTDQNLFQILEYDSRANTPPAARFTEPRRIISGTNTHAEMMCGVYIDPKTLDIYVLNNDTQTQIPVFSPDARGNATPSRMLTNIRGFGIAMHEERQEMFIANQDGIVYVYRKHAAGNERPIRVLRGNDTQLADPHGIAIDTKNNLFFVSNFGSARVTRDPDGSTEEKGYGKFEPPSITVYPLLASGNTKPLWTIQGPKTLMNWPSHLALHQERRELFVANDAGDSVLVFRTTDKGDVAPIRVIQGPNTGIKHPPGITVDEKRNELFVASMGNVSVRVFPVTANGNVSPLRIVRGGPQERLPSTLEIRAVLPTTPNETKFWC
jgi:DNA-binding beta-propeller fold protein YncE